jgi:hypothetical protein
MVFTNLYFGLSIEKLVFYKSYRYLGLPKSLWYSNPLANTIAKGITAAKKEIRYLKEIGDVP